MIFPKIVTCVFIAALGLFCYGFYEFSAVRKGLLAWIIISYVIGTAFIYMMSGETNKINRMKTAFSQPLGAICAGIVVLPLVATAIGLLAWLCPSLGDFLFN